MTALFLFFINNIVTGAHKKGISQLFEQAENEYRKFTKDTRSHIYPERWEKCINRYREIVILDEKSEFADDAAYMVAYIYFRMFERFSNQAYLNSALSSFSFLFSKYPDSVFVQKALYYTGFIYYKYRNDRESARQYFDTLVERYPGGRYAEDAKKLLDDIARAVVIQPPVRTGKFAVLNDLRYWSSPDYTRVVIYLDSPAAFENRRIYDPERIYFDFERTRISEKIAEWMMTVEDNFLKRVRIGHFNPRVTRVVLDLEKVDKYNVFSLADPFRVIIDVMGSGFEKSRPVPDLAGLTGGSEALKTGEKVPTSSKDLSGEKEDKAGTGKESESAASNQTLSKKADSSANDKAVISPQKTAKSDSSGKSSDDGLKESVTVVPLRNSSGNYSIVRQLGLGVTTIMLDPGHGGKDPGMIVSKGVYEKDLVLDFAFRLKAVLEKDKKYQVYLTRESDVYVPLEERTAKAMQYKADLFISLHMNSNRANSLYGLETYFLGFATDRQTEALAAQENAISQKSIGELQEILRLMVNAKVEESKDLAKIISMGVSGHLQSNYSFFRSRGVKQAPFIVLLGAGMPSVLIELGYLSNPLEGKNLLMPLYRQNLSEALAKSVEDYINNLNGRLAEG